jgi:hypothetical protein
MNGVDFSFGKPKPVVPSFMSLNDHHAFAAPGGLFEPPGRRKKFGDGHFGFGTLVTP